MSHNSFWFSYLLSANQRPTICVLLSMIFLSNFLCAGLVQPLALHYERRCFGPPLILQRNRSNLTSLALIHRRFLTLRAFDVLLLTRFNK